MRRAPRADGRSQGPLRELSGSDLFVFAIRRPRRPRRSRAPGGASSAVFAQRRRRHDLALVQERQVVELERPRRQHEDAVETGHAPPAPWTVAPGLAGPVGDERDRDVAPLIARQAADLDGQIGEHTRVFRPRCERKPSRRGRSRRAEPPESMRGCRRLSKKRTQTSALLPPTSASFFASASASPRANTCGCRASTRCRRPGCSGAGARPLPGARARSTADRRTASFSMNSSSSWAAARQQGVGVAAPLDGGVAVDREALRARAALGLEQRRQQLQRKIDDVRRARRPDHVHEVRRARRRARSETGRTAGRLTARSAAGGRAPSAPAHTTAG